jgi:hypothetical protein
MRTVALLLLAVACHPDRRDPSDSDPVTGDTDVGPDDDADGWTTTAGDCDDDDPDVHPGLEDGCNDLDDDCDGEIDEDPDHTWYVDEDGDSWGGHAILSCTSDGYVSRHGDCDDADPVIHPSAEEDCDLVDDDCDGEVDLCRLTPASHVLYGVVSWDGTGEDLSYAGDVDGDGRTDLLVGVWGEENGTARDPSSVVLVGTTRLGTHGESLEDLALATFTSSASGEIGVRAARSAGDVDGDGLADVVLAGTRDGALGLAVFPATDLAGGAILSVDQAGLWLPASPGAASLQPLGVLGDLDGDGVEEVAWETAGSGASATTIASAAAVASGDLAGAWTIEHPSDVGSTALDEGFLARGDVDGDGVDELAFRDLSGSLEQQLVVIDPTTLSPGATIADEDGERVALASGLLSTRVSATDADGDGRSELLAFDAHPLARTLYVVSLAEEPASTFDDVTTRVESSFGAVDLRDTAVPLTDGARTALLAEMADHREAYEADGQGAMGAFPIESLEIGASVTLEDIVAWVVVDMEAWAGPFPSSNLPFQDGSVLGNGGFDPIVASTRAGRIYLYDDIAGF